MMSKSIQLKTGGLMPLMGFGTFRLTGYETIFNSLDAALKSGYRLIDTAQVYKNESDIGRALATLMPKYGLKRQDLFITSKLSTLNMSSEKVRPSVERSLIDLQLDYLDLFLIHHAKPDWLDAQDPKVKDARRDTWLELEKLHAEGKLLAIGVSNYEIRHLDEIAQYGTVQPSVLQVEFHPHYCRRDLLTEVRRRGIHFQAFTSLGRNNPTLISEPLLIELAQKYKCPIAHILLAWPMCQGIAVIPKSANPDRVRENFEAEKVKLSDEDVEKVWGLHKNINYTLCRPWEVL